MRRSALLVPFVPLLVVAASGIGPRGAAAVQEGSLPPNHPCVGAWAVTADQGPDLPSIPLLFTFASDGTALGSLPNPRRGVPGGAELGAEILEDSGMHGAWEATGDRTCDVTLRFFTSSAEGEFLVTTTLSAALDVAANGDDLSAEATLVDIDAAGENVGSLSVPATASRITVEPRRTDAPGVGTPSA